MLTQARLTAACNALHQIDERFCRWLLQSADRAGGDTVALTQELLAEMLGVRGNVDQCVGAAAKQ